MIFPSENKKLWLILYKKRVIVIKWIGWLRVYFVKTISLISEMMNPAFAVAPVFPENGVTVGCSCPEAENGWLVVPPAPLENSGTFVCQSRGTVFQAEEFRVTVLPNMSPGEGFFLSLRNVVSRWLGFSVDCNRRFWVTVSHRFSRVRERVCAKMLRGLTSLLSRKISAGYSPALPMRL